MTTPEAKVRNPVVKWAKAQGILHQRQSYRPGVKQAFPDDVFLLPGGRPYYIEFKRPGKQPTPLQQHRIDSLKEIGYDADYFDNTQTAIAALEKAILRSGWSRNVG